MQELTIEQVNEVSGAGAYEKCVAGYTLGGALFGAAIGVGTTFGIGGVGGFGIGATLGAVAGAYFCG
jgi:hypothetical protein